MQDLNYHSACNNYPNRIINMSSRRYIGLTNLLFFLLSAGRELSTVAAVFVYLVDQQTKIPRDQGYRCPMTGRRRNQISPFEPLRLGLWPKFPVYK